MKLSAQLRLTHPALCEATVQNGRASRWIGLICLTGLVCSALYACDSYQANQINADTAEREAAAAAYYARKLRQEASKTAITVYPGGYACRLSVRPTWALGASQNCERWGNEITAFMAVAGKGE